MEGTPIYRTPPIRSYFDPAVLNSERRLMFERGVRYVGHRLMVPREDDYIVPARLDDRYVLFNRGDHFDIVSNVCPHRQARLLTGSGRTRNIVCKLHCWSFSPDGKLRKAPYFTGEGQRDLTRRTLTEWNGLLFDGRAPDLDLKEAKIDDMVNFDDYVYAGSETEIYLDDYHVFAIHPGLRRYIDLDDVEWKCGPDYSIQYAGLTRNIDRPGSAAFAPWHESLKEHYGSDLPRYGALWMYIYPNIMIEWYPHLLLISTIDPLQPQVCVHHSEFYYSKAIYAKDPDYYEQGRKWLTELAAEDAEACRQQSKGRRALFMHGEEEPGAVHPTLETGMGELYNFLNDAY
jgi:choline monooxygenase